MGRDYGEHGRCEAHSKTAGRQCKQPATDNRGKCHYHGGATPIQHGIYSDVVRPEDRELLDALEAIETRQKLEETLNLQIMKLRRAVELTASTEAEQRDFWDTFQSMIHQGSVNGREAGLSASQIRELAGFFNASQTAQMELMDLIRKTAKDLHKIEDDSPDRIEHSVDTDRMDEFAAAIGLDGDDDTDA